MAILHKLLYYLFPLHKSNTCQISRILYSSSLTIVRRMTSVCDTCKAKTRSEYWLNSAKHSFVSVMFGDYEDQMSIPRKFVDNFQERLPEWCKLRGPSGKKWKVRIARSENGVFFTDGWNNFLKDHSIQFRDLLVLTYQGNSTFTVLMFDTTRCEKEGSYFTHVNMSKSTSCTSVFHVEEEEEEDENEMTDDSESSLRRNYSTESTDCNNEAENTHYNAVYKGKWKVHKQPESGDSMSEDEDDDEEEEQEMNQSFSGCSRGKQVQTIHVSRRREVTEQEKRRAGKRDDEYIKKAKSDGFPMVGITMLPTHVYKGLCLTIPKEWAMKHMAKEDHDVELRIPESIDYWLVGVRWTLHRNSQCHIRPKWSEFVLDNNLEEGDVCVFKLVNQGESRPVFHVKIFRVIKEVVPLIQKRGTF